MSIDKVQSVIHLPYDREAVIKGGPALADLFKRLIYELEQNYLKNISITLNYVLDSTGSVSIIYFGLPSSAGVYPTGTWRISTASTYYRLERFDGADWIVMSSLSSAAVLTLTALTLTSFSGVLKATAGVVAGGATLDDVAEGTSYKRVPAATYTDLTDSGASTLHYHASDRARANHSGTQAAATISDFDTEVSNNTDVEANTSARHAAATVADTNSINMTLTSQEVKGDVVIQDTTSVDLAIDGSGLKATVLPAGVDHNSLSNYVAEQHTTHAGSKAGTVAFNDGDAIAHSITVAAGGIITSWLKGGVEQLT